MSYCHRLIQEKITANPENSQANLMPTVLTLLLSMPEVEGEKQEQWLLTALGLIHTNILSAMKGATCRNNIIY